MGDIQLGPVGSYITLHPTWDYESAKHIDKIDVRVTQGPLYTYIGQGSFRRIVAPESYVSSLNRTLVNSWWETGTQLRFIEDSDYASSYYSVRIIGDTEPYPSYAEHYYLQYWRGELVLETV